MEPASLGPKHQRLSQRPRWTGVALYLPSHSLIFSSTNSSPFARSWFCQKRTKDTGVGLLPRGDTPSSTPEGQGHGASGHLGTGHTSTLKKPFILLGGGFRGERGSGRHPTAKEGDESQTPTASLLPGKRLPQARPNSTGGQGRSPNVLQAPHLNSGREARRQWEVMLR